MADEVVDTLATPGDTGTVSEADAAVTEYTNTGEPVVPEQPPAEPVIGSPPPPPPLTPEEIEERAFQRTTSWLGRREKEFSDNILRNVSQLLESKLAHLRGPEEPAPVGSSTDIFDNPDKWARTVIPKILHEEISKQTKAEQNFNTEVIRHAANLMDSNPLYTDKTLGNEVVAEIQKGFHSVNRSLPPDVAAELTVNRALAKVIAARTAVKANPLTGNTPVTGIGTIKPSGVAPTGKAPPVKLDDIAKKVASWFGNTEEDVRDMLK